MAGKTWSQVADELKTSPRTIWELRQGYDLDNVLTQLVADQLQQITTGYQALIAKASAKLWAMLDSPDPDNVKWAIARLWPKDAPMPSAPVLPVATTGAPTARVTSTSGVAGDSSDRTGVVARAGAARKRLASG